MARLCVFSLQFPKRSMLRLCLPKKLPKEMTVFSATGNLDRDRFGPFGSFWANGAREFCLFRPDRSWTPKQTDG